MADAKTPSFGRVIRERRRQLNLTQEEVAQRIKTSTPYIGLLEGGKRNPSRKVVCRVNYFCRPRQLFLPVSHQGYWYSLSSIVIHRFSG